jgi:hypothetical protein
MAIQSPSLELGGTVVQPTAAAASRGYWKSVARRLRRDPVTLICAAVLILIVLASLAAPWLGLADPYKTSMIRRLYPIGSPNHLLGTDELGRDMLARLVYGGRLSLFMGVTPVLGALLIGGLLGITAGFLGGRTNMAIMRVMDVFYAFPSERARKTRCCRSPWSSSRRSAASRRASPPRSAASISSMPRGPAARARSPSCACTCWATCSGRSWSTLRR